MCYYTHRYIFIYFVCLSGYRNTTECFFTCYYSVCHRDGSENSWPRYQSVLWIRMEHLWLLSDTPVCMWSDYSFRGSFICVCGDTSTTSAAATVQAEETLQRRVWDSSPFDTTHVFNRNCHACFILLLCHHWYGAVCRLWHAQLLRVSTSSEYCSL